MGTLQEALEKSGVLFYKNRYGDTAVFELWNLAQDIPHDWVKRCGLCGKRTNSFYRVLWNIPTKCIKEQCYICDGCFVHGREHDSRNFPPLKEEPNARPDMFSVRSDAQVPEKRRSD